MEFRAWHGCHGDHKLHNTCQTISLDECNSLILALKEIFLNLMQNFPFLRISYHLKSFSGQKSVKCVISTPFGAYNKPYGMR